MPITDSGNPICLFCYSAGPFTRTEHIIPAALGNDDLVLTNEVCDKCNQYFGSKIENFVLSRTPIGMWRTLLGISGRKGKLPRVDLTQPNRQAGRLPSRHTSHDNIVLDSHKDRSVSVSIDNDEIIRDILSGVKDRFTFVLTPKALSMIGRFLCKVGLELLCSVNPEYARNKRFNLARRFARSGFIDELWPIFVIEKMKYHDLRKLKYFGGDAVEEVFCYDYQLYEIGDQFTLLSLTIGTCSWITCLNDPYPTPVIRLAFPNQEMKLVWYPKEQI